VNQAGIWRPAEEWAIVALLAYLQAEVAPYHVPTLQVALYALSKPCEQFGFIVGCEENSSQYKQILFAI
jgi:hypothetical protein